MKQILFWGFIFLSTTLLAQTFRLPSASEIKQAPYWAKAMYQPLPNLWHVDSLYRNYYNTHPFEKSYHTQYYKRWKRFVINYTDTSGFVVIPEMNEQQQRAHKLLAQHGSASRAAWSLIGPIKVWKNGTERGHDQCNVYCIDQCMANPQVLYAGTEPGEVYKSTDGGQNWVNISLAYGLGGGTPIWDSGVNAIEVDPTNPDIVFSGSGQTIHKSIDGGQTWTQVMLQSNLGVNELLIQPDQTNIVFAATEKGLFRSSDGGINWTQLYNQKCYDIKNNAAHADTLYMVKNNPSLDRAEFFVSTDAGITWALSDNGWYNSTDPDRYDGGARIAVTPADPERIYVYLIGDSKPNDYGFIGVYRTDDGGANWTLPNGPPGGPYTANHINLAMGSPSWNYHQGFYNCAIAASSSNADEILVGGLNLYKSTDGGFTFSSLAGYVGGPLEMHVDMQDFRAFNNTTFISTDGGIYQSNDFFDSQPERKMDGIHSSDFWGFGSGWNEDVLVGGLYHNGNLGYYQYYNDGDFLNLGGGEAPTGYVNPGFNREAYFSDIQRATLPTSLNDPIQYGGLGQSPNESYWPAESSEIEFHPSYYNVAFCGKENKLWMTTDRCANFTLIHSFGNLIDDQIKSIEICLSNPEVMYVTQQPGSGVTGKLWRSNDGGNTWAQISIPAGNSRRMLISVDAVNPDELWMAWADGSNGNKIFKTTNGGTNWINLSSSELDNQNIQSLLHISGTDGGVYCGTQYRMYYRNNSMNNWNLINNGLPLYINTNILKPFYRDNKVRLASYGKGIWESALEENPAFPIAKAQVNTEVLDVICSLDSFYFEDHSIMEHTGASWQWSFPGGSPASSTLRNPAVYFANPGIYACILTITNANQQSDTDTIYITVNQVPVPTVINEDFQNNWMPPGWFQTNWDQGGTWQIDPAVGGFSQSDRCAKFDNFNIDSGSSFDDLSFKVNPSVNSQTLSFDVAYAPYGGQYSDTLQVLISTDCGATYTLIYTKGGATLATAPQTSNPFVPTAAEWRTETIDLTSWSGIGEVLISFRNIGHWGNTIYIDNVNLGTPTGMNTQPAYSFEIFPNPVCSGDELFIHSSGDELISLSIYSSKGQRVANYGGTTKMIVPELSSGTYLVELVGTKSISRRKLILKKDSRF